MIIIPITNIYIKFLSLSHVGKGGEDGLRGLSDEGGVGGSETLPAALPLHHDAPLHKRLYPRWYQAYMYKVRS